VQGEFKSRFNSEQYEFKVTSINMLDVTKQSFTKSVTMDLPIRAVTPEFVNFFEKNVKTYPGKSQLKFNITEPHNNLKLSMYTLEKGFTKNDEFVQFLEENVDVEVKVECA
jgi:DNA polymerase-3 subunit alpha